MAITMLRKKPQGDRKELDEKGAQYPVNFEGKEIRPNLAYFEKILDE